MSSKSRGRPHGDGRRRYDKPWWMDPDAKAWLAHAADTLPGMIGNSKVAVSIVADEVDPKFAVELGYMIMLNKPIVLVVPNGRTVPDKLALVADKIVEWRDDEAAMKQAVMDALDELGGGIVEEDSNG